MIAQQALADAVRKLKAVGIDGAARDARILMAQALQIDAARLTLALQDDLPEDVLKRFDDAIQRRTQREPVSHILGYREFFGRRFNVSSDVLDPRPDTEALIEQALAQPFSKVLDLGTGSGCILITLLAEQPDATGTGLDLSDAALRVATRNADLNRVVNRTEFVQSDWFAKIEGKFDLIVSNPPYIDESEWQTLEPEVQQWEPKTALTPGADGLEPYRLIAAQAGAYLTDQGRVLVEIGWQQGEAVAEIFRTEGWRNIAVMQDLNGKDRVVSATNA